jgi:hypothetical protein
MRHARRNGHTGLEFGGSGEDSFVAVVVTKLTGALLFILLLTMVIMALLPKAVELPSSGRGEESAERAGLTVTTPETLPEAIAGRPYVVALAASGGRGPLKWAVAGPLPDGLDLDPATGRIQGTPRAGTPRPVELALRVSDGSAQATQTTRLVVYQSDRPLTTPSWWKPGVPPVPWRAWLEQGFGFLVLWLVYLVGMNTVAGLQRWSLAGLEADPSASEHDRRAVRGRFLLYRLTVRLASLSAAAALAVWLVRHRL